MGSKRCVVGVDLGGTNVRAQALWEDGSPAGERCENPSHAQSGTSAILHATAQTITEAMQAAETAPVGVGLAIPGSVDDRQGLVKWAPNFGEVIDGVFHYWKNVPIRKPLESACGIPVSMGNDANCAALGEYQYGSGRGSARCLVMLTLGTGIGGGVVLSPYSVMGKASGPLVLLGGNLAGVELGHTLLQRGGLDSTAGIYGTLESYCQRDSIIRRAQYKLIKGRESLVRDSVGGDLGLVTPKHLSEAAAQGDALALEVWREVGGYLGAGVGSLINVFAPDVFAIGGQISKAGPWLMEAVFEEARNIAIESLFVDCRIVLAEQVEDAGLYGAASLALQATHSP